MMKSWLGVGPKAEAATIMSDFNFTVGGRIKQKWDSCRFETRVFR